MGVFGFRSGMTALDISAAHILQRQLKQQLPLGHKALEGLFAIRESTGGASHAMIAQDTGTVWLPKVLVARSWAERFECSFVEFVESAFFYYMVPFSSGKWFQQLYRKVAPGNVSLADVMKPVVGMTAAERQRILPIKAACLLSGFGIVTIGGEYALNFVKNLLTQGFFKKSNFADVVNLRHNDKLNTHENTGNQPQRTPVTERALKRIIECWAICGALFASSLWLAKHGGRYPKLVDGLDDVLRKYDFKYDLKNRRFGLALPHFKVMLPIAVLGYIDAARDRLEFVETSIRATATAYFLGWGSPALEKWAAKRFGHTLTGLMKPGTDEVKPMAELFADSIAHAQKMVPNGDQTQLVKIAKTYFMPRLTRKAQIYLLPVGTGMAVVGLFVALMNQFWTKYRYKALQQEEHDFTTRYTHANPHGVKQHWQDITNFTR